MLRWMTSGESHGRALIASMEGVPAGLPLTTEDLRTSLARRRLGYGRGARQTWEQDKVTIISGVRHGLTTGSPISILIENSEWPKWETVMSPDPVPPQALLIDAGTGDEREVARNKTLTRPRPGHADFAGMISYDVHDARIILERASARETAARVALGTIAELILRHVASVELISHVTAVAEERNDNSDLPVASDLEALDKSPVRTLDRDAEERFVGRIDAARKNADTVGGTVEVVAWNVPIGLGTHTVARQRLDAEIAGALMSIQSVKAVEIGDGFRQAALPGSLAHDEIFTDDSGGVQRSSNRAGGIEGGMSNGEPIVVRAAFKPISTVPRALRSIDMNTGQQAPGLHQRSDTCQVVPGAIIAQAEVALVLANALLRHTGGYSLAECQRNFASYMERVKERLTWENTQ